MGKIPKNRTSWNLALRSLHACALPIGSGRHPYPPLALAHAADVQAFLRRVQRRASDAHLLCCCFDCTGRCGPPLHFLTQPRHRRLDLAGPFWPVAACRGMRHLCFKRKRCHCWRPHFLGLPRWACPAIPSWLLAALAHQCHQQPAETALDTSSNENSGVTFHRSPRVLRLMRLW